MFGLDFSSSSSKTESNPWAPQGDALKFIYGQASDIYNQGPYNGLYASNMGALESGMMNSAYDYYSGGAGAQSQNAMQQFANQAMGSLDQAQQMYDDIAANPITNQAIMDNMNQGIIDSQVSGASEAVQEMLAATQNANDQGAMSSGNLGSSAAMKMQNQAAQEASNDLANQYSNIYNQQYANTQNLMQGQQSNAMQVANQYNNMANMGQQANMNAQNMYNQGVGVMGQMAGLERDQADRNIQNAMGQQNSAWDWLNQYNNIIGGHGSWGGTTSSSGTTMGASASFPGL